MSIDLNVAGLVVGVVMALAGLGVQILWPDKKWIGWICIGMAIVVMAGWVLYESRRIIGYGWVTLTIFVLVGAVAGGCLGGLVWYIWKPVIANTRTDTADQSTAIAELTKLGWTVKPGTDDIQFEIANKPLPSIKESAPYFAQLQKPWYLHFQQVRGIEGLHELATMKGCFKIEINAGEFSDISELNGFDHLTTLTISQTPLNGLSVVDATPLSSLISLHKLNLYSTKVRDAKFLARLTELQELNLGSTLVRDLSPLSGHHALTSLEIRDSEVADLTPISGIQSLNQLVVSGKQVPGLVKLVNLKRLTIIEQSPVDLSPVARLNKLEYLWLWVDRFDLLPLRGLKNLRELMLTGMGLGTLNVVSNAESMGELSQLRKLTLGSIKIHDLLFTRYLVNLEELDISRVPITSIVPLRSIKSLKTVSLTSTNVSDISPLLDLPLLTNVNVSRSPARADVLSELERRGVSVQR